MRGSVLALTAVVALAALSSCGGGGGSATNNGAFVPTSSGSNVPAGAGDQSVALGARPMSVDLPPVGGVTGRIAFPAVAAPATLTLSASAAAPSGVALQSLRHPAGDARIAIYEYITIAPVTTIALPVLPALSFTFPPSATIAGKSFFYGITDPVAQPGALVAFQTEGPAKVVGNVVSIAAVARPLVLEAGHRYTFIAYAISVSPNATTPTVFVANLGSNSVTTYRADGSPTAPVITSGLIAPQAVGVDASGTIHVLNVNADGVPVLTTYAPDGAQILPTIVLPGIHGRDQFRGITGLAVSASGISYVTTTQLCSFTCAAGSLFSYAPDGTPGLAVPLPFGGVAVAVGANGHIYVVGADGTLTTYLPDGTIVAPALHGLKTTIDIAVDTAGKVYLADPNGIAVYTADGTPSAPTIRPNFVPGAIAVDAAGKIYVADTIDGQIFSYNPDGSPSAPTITTGANPAGMAVH